MRLPPQGPIPKLAYYYVCRMSSDLAQGVPL